MKKMLNVLLVLYVDPQHVPLQVVFVGTEYSDSMPSLPLSIYPGYLQQSVYPLSLNFVSEQITVSISGSRTQSYSLSILCEEILAEGLYSVITVWHCNVCNLKSD